MGWDEPVLWERCWSQCWELRGFATGGWNKGGGTVWDGTLGMVTPRRIPGWWRLEALWVPLVLPCPRRAIQHCCPAPHPGGFWVPPRRTPNTSLVPVPALGTRTAQHCFPMGSGNLLHRPHHPAFLKPLQRRENIILINNFRSINDQGSKGRREALDAAGPRSSWQVLDGNTEVFVQSALQLLA